MVQIIKRVHQYNEPKLFGDEPYVYKINPDRMDYTPASFLKAAIPNRENKKVISFINNKKKLLIWLSPAFFHAIRDFLFQIIAMHFGPYGPYQIIVDIRNNELAKNDFNRVIFDMLKRLGIDFVRFDSSNYDFLEINNFVTVGGFDATPNSMLAYEKLQVYLTNRNVTPFRKIYISRKIRDTQVPVGVYPDERISDHESMEKIFSDAGFEIAYPETFKRFEDQLQYFYEAKVIAGISGSGLTNSLFMQPGQTVIEIVSPLSVPHFDEGIRSDLHHFYKELSFLKNHLLINIPNNDLGIEALLENTKNVLKSIDF